MPTEQEIIDRLASYCVRLEDDLGAPLHRRNFPLRQPSTMVLGDDKPTEIRESERNDRRNLFAAAAAVVFVVLGVGALILFQSRRVDPDPADTVTPATADSEPLPTSASTVPESSNPPTTTTPLPTTSTALLGNLLRPAVDPKLCAPLSATGDGDEIGSTFDLHLFAWPTTASSFPIQIIGDPDGGPAAPFALLQRYPDQTDLGHGPIVTINDWDVSLDLFDNGNGDARWALPDGGQGYLRSRGLDRDALIAIISSLTARASSAAIPGFDYDPGPNAPATLKLLVEHLNTDVTGRSATLQCATTNFIYQITTIDGDPVFQYALVIDRPVPLEVGYQDGTLVVIGGNQDPTAPTIHDVFNTSQAAWDDLLANPAT